MVRALTTAVVLLALAALLGACGDDGPKPAGATSTGTNSLTVYSSLPLQGPDAADSRSIVNGEKLALDQANGKVGPFAVRYVSLDDAKDGRWNADVVSDNARRAARDNSTIAYLGEFDDLATAISLPITNEAGILQISPANTGVGLTQTQGAEPGEPDKYYPSGVRSFGRVIPADDKQAAAQAVYQKDTGCTLTYVLHDNTPYGQGIADAVAADLARIGIKISGNDGVDPDATSDRDLADKVKSSGVDCVFYGGTPGAGAARLWNAVHAADPALKIFAPAPFAAPAFAKAVGPAGVTTYVTSPALGPKAFPADAEKFFTDYRTAFGEEPEPYAIYGYESMNAVLESIRAAGSKGNDRQAVTDAFFAIHDRQSVLGMYSINKRGDTTLTTYGGARYVNGQVVFDQVIDSGS